MKEEIKRLEEKIDRIEKKLEILPYPLKNLIDCSIDFDLKLRPMYPTSSIQDIHLSTLETRIKADIYKEIKQMEYKINEHLRYI